MFSLSNINTLSSRRSWEQDLKTVITDQQWKTIMLNSKRICRNFKAQEIQFKIIHKLQTTPYYRSKYDNECSGVCVRCKQHVGSYIHLIWSCPVIHTFWIEIGSKISSIIQHSIELNPLQCILGLHDASPELNKFKRILSILWYCARLSILQRWLDGDKPSVSNWLENVLRLLPLERLTHVLQRDMNGFFFVWSPVIDFMGEDYAEIILKGFATLGTKHVR